MKRTFWILAFGIATLLATRAVAAPFEVSHAVKLPKEVFGYRGGMGDIIELKDGSLLFAHSPTGKGIMAVADGHRVLVGNAALLEQMNVTTAKAAPAADELAAAGNTPMIVAIDDTVAGVIAMADTLRPDAAQMIAQLHRAGVRKVVMLTGDAPRVAQAVAAQTGIDEVHAGLLPEDKLTVVQQLQYMVKVTGRERQRL